MEPDEIRQLEFEYFSSQAAHPTDETLADFLHRHGIDADTLAEMGLDVTKSI